MPWSGAGVGFGYGLVWPLLGLLLLAVVVVGAVYLFGAEAAGTGTGSDRATELLRERYARGDLTDEEFERRAARLAGDAGESSTAR
jgi:putative membrane protein